MGYDIFQRLIAQLRWPSETCVEVKACISLEFMIASRERFGPLCYTVPLNCVHILYYYYYLPIMYKLRANSARAKGTSSRNFRVST